MRYSCPELDELIGLLEKESLGEAFEKERALYLIDALMSQLPDIRGSLEWISWRLRSSIEAAPAKPVGPVPVMTMDSALGYSIFPW